MKPEGVVPMPDPDGRDRVGWWGAEVVRRLLMARGETALAHRAPDFRGIAGRTVLLTGAAGSVGTGIAVAMLTCSVPVAVIALDHDDTGLQRLLRRCQTPRLTPFLGDVRDPAAVRRAVERHAPQVVVHCAALKHGDLLQMYPHEALRTNVVGTACVAREAAAIGAHFVNVSSDKAASALNVLGASKRLGERIIAAIARRHAASAASVRLGNVIDSRGAAVECFVERAAVGLPLHITDPTMTRYIMTTAEAVTLVMQAAIGPARGECHVPDLGREVSVGNIARCVLEVSGSAAGTVTVGARPGDSMSELLIGKQELWRDAGDGTFTVSVDPWHEPEAIERMLRLPAAAVASELLKMAAASDLWDSSGEAVQ